MRFLVKCIIIITTCSCCAIASAQLDTVYFMPYAQLSYDTTRWIVYDDDAPASQRREVSFQSRLDKKLVIRIEMSLMEDSVTTLDEIVAEMKDDFENEDDIQVNVLEEKFIGNMFFYSFQIEPYECSEEIFSEADLLKDVTITLAKGVVCGDVKVKIEPEEDLYFFANHKSCEAEMEELLRGIKEITPEQADVIDHYPFEQDYADSLVRGFKEKRYATLREHFISKRQCYDDEYLMEFLSEEYGKQLIDSLSRFQEEEQLAEKYALAESRFETDGMEMDLNHRVTVGYTHTEVVALKRKIRDSQYPLYDYLDALYKTNGDDDFSRLATLLEQSPRQIVQYGMYDNHDYRGRLHSAISRDLFGDSLQVKNHTVTDFGSGSLYTLEGTNEHEVPFNLMVQFTPTETGWLHRILPMPDALGNSEEGQWNITEREDCPQYLIMYSGRDHMYYFTPAGGSDFSWTTTIPASIDTAKFFVQIGGLADMASRYNDWMDDGEVMFVRLNDNGVIRFFQSTLQEKKLLDRFHKKLVDENETQTIDDENADDRKGKMHIMSNEYISRWEYGSLLALWCAPSDKVLCSQLITEDLNADDIPDIYHFAVSNGKLIYFEGYTLEEGKIVSMNKKKSFNLLQKKNLYMNMLAESLKGNYEGYEVEQVTEE